jgi:hypothetical protein
MGSLRSGRIVDHATLGARVGFDDQNRVVVIDLAEQSDAFRRGLRYGDEILSFGGRTISTPNGFKNILGIYPKGWRVPLVFRHEGKREEQLVRLSALHGEGELAQALARPQKPPDEKPKPDRPKDSKPKPKPKPKDEDIPIPKPGEHGRRMGHPAAPLPQVVKDHLEKRPGFANYYFNKLNRDRVLAAWRARGNFRTAPGEWTLAGPLPRGAEYRFTLSDKAAVLKLPTTEIAWSDKEPIASTLVPTGSGGLLPALWLWRRLAVLEPDQFGEVTYLGTAPVPGAAEPADVLLALAGGVECRFYFDSKTGLLLLIEMYPEEHADPCELYFRDYREVQGRAAPGTIEARYGDDAFGTFQVKSLQWGGGT